MNSDTQAMISRKATSSIDGEKNMMTGSDRQSAILERSQTNASGFSQNFRPMPPVKGNPPIITYDYQEDYSEQGVFPRGPVMDYMNNAKQSIVQKLPLSVIGSGENESLQSGSPVTMPAQT